MEFGKFVGGEAEEMRPASMEITTAELRERFASFMLVVDTV